MRPSARSQHKGLTIEGYSRAAVQTYWRVPELKLGFDLGAQPWSFMATPNWFVSHTHLDHIAALPVLVARRRMMKMEPPTIYLPAEAVEGVELLLRRIQRLDRGRMPATWSGSSPDDEIELSRELVVKAFPTRHTIPSLGYLVWERRKKLKPEYQRPHRRADPRPAALGRRGLGRDPRCPGSPTWAIPRPGARRLPEIYQAQILILEMTFVAPNERPALIHKFGHTHLDDLLARADRFENEVIIASHFSTRLHPDQIQRIVEKRLPESLRGRLKIWL